jgi:hypothetical protein
MDTPSEKSAFIRPQPLREEFERSLGPLSLELRYHGAMNNDADVRSGYKRVWVERLGGNHTNPAVEQYFMKNSRVVFQSYRSQVNLFDGARDLTQQVASP